MIGFSMSTPISPTNIFVLDMQTNKIDRITSALLSNIPTDIMAEPEILSYTSFDVPEIPFLLYKPRNIGKKQKAGCVISYTGDQFPKKGPSMRMKDFINI
jgi:dipeptidyl aminopeptidase/acylaminoacyl peptidase